MVTVGALSTRRNVGRHLVLVTAGVMAAVFVGTAVLLITTAWEYRASQAEALRSAANAISQVLDREVAGAHSLLLGLSASPALAAGDFGAFHQQLLKTPVPDGAWLVVSDREKLLLHSLRAYGTKLPYLSEFTPQPAFFERLETLNFALTGRVRGVILDTVTVTANLKIPDASGRLRYFLTTVISDKRFIALLRQQGLPAEMQARIYDHNLAGVVSFAGNEAMVAPDMPDAC